MNLFNEKINNWNEWSEVRQSISEFTPLVEHIFRKEGLLFSEIKTIAPGINAVFKVGGYVVKIFMPPELFNDGDFGTNVNVEVFGMKLANAYSVSAPKLIVYGTVDDKYSFRYMIMEYIQGKMLDEKEILNLWQILCLLMFYGNDYEN